VARPGGTNCEQEAGKQAIPVGKMFSHGRRKKRKRGKRKLSIELAE
jgi:hypothetical protein